MVRSDVLVLASSFTALFLYSWRCNPFYDLFLSGFVFPLSLWFKQQINHRLMPVPLCNLLSVQEGSSLSEERGYLDTVWIFFFKPCLVLQTFIRFEMTFLIKKKIKSKKKKFKKIMLVNFGPHFLG